MVKIDILKWCDTYTDLKKKKPEYYQNAEETKGYLETSLLSLLIASFTCFFHFFDPDGIFCS